MRAFQSQIFARNPRLVDFGALSTPYSRPFVSRHSADMLSRMLSLSVMRKALCLQIARDCAMPQPHKELLHFCTVSLGQQRPLSGVLFMVVRGTLRLPRRHGRGASDHGLCA